MRGGRFARIQFTPICSLPISPQRGLPSPGCEFRVSTRPLFNHLVLADEINRSPAKVQSALLEAMAEHQITVARRAGACPPSSWLPPPRTPSSRKGPIPCRRPSSIASCSSCWWITPAPPWSWPSSSSTPAATPCQRRRSPSASPTCWKPAPPFKGYRCRGASSTIWCSWCALPAPAAACAPS
nr:AAA family ATPase [Aeromonas caviae]